MAAIVDNLIAYRMLTLLVKPFPETEAFKLGIIDEKGANLIKARNLKTKKEKDAYSYLHRLVFNLKKLLNKLPGGDTYTRNLVAAFFLIKEAYQQRALTVNEEDLERLIVMIEEGVILAEEQLTVNEFMLMEDAPTNATGAAVSTDQPVIKRRAKRFAKFVVNDEVFRRFASGKSKFRKWSEYLNLEDDGQKQIYNFARRNPSGVIVLQNGQQTKSIRYNPQGGGAWSKIKRPIKQVNNEVV